MRQWQWNSLLCHLHIVDICYNFYILSNTYTTTRNMKSEYYTLHTNGSFDKIDVNELFNKKVTYKKWKKFLNRTTLVISFNLIILLLLGVALIVILSIHISQNILFKISTLLQVR